MSNAMTEPPYLEALRQQEQADMDGTMVRVSRQAVDEAIADIERLRAALKPFANFCTAIDGTEAGRLAPTSQVIHAGLTVGSFRNARAALHPAPIQKEEK